MPEVAEPQTSQLNTIVEGLINDGESEEVIAEFIRQWEAPESEEEAALRIEQEQQEDLKLAREATNDAIMTLARVPEPLRGIASSVNQTALGLLKGPVDFAKSVAFGLDDEVQAQLEENPEAVGEIWDNYWNALDNWEEAEAVAGAGTTSAQIGESSWSKLIGEGRIADGTAVLAEQTAGGAISLIPAFFGPWGAAFLGVGAAGSAFDEDVQDEVKIAEATKDGSSALPELYTSSLLKGGVEFATELVTARIAGVAKKALAGGATQAQVKEMTQGLLGSTFGAFNAEGLSEGLADTASKIVDELVYNTEHEASDVLRGFWDNYIIGGLIGGKVAYVGNAGARQQAQNAVYQATKTEEHLDAEKAAKSELKDTYKHRKALEDQGGDDAVIDALKDREKAIVQEVEERNKQHQETIDDLSESELQEYAKSKDKINRLQQEKKKQEQDDPAIDEAIEAEKEKAQRVYTAPAREKAGQEVIKEIEAKNEEHKATLEDAAKPQQTADGKPKAKTKKQKLNEKKTKEAIKENEKLIKEVKKEIARPKDHVSKRIPDKKAPRKDRIAANVGIVVDPKAGKIQRDKAYNAILKDTAQEQGTVAAKVRNSLELLGIKVDPDTLSGTVRREVAKLIGTHKEGGAAIGTRILNPNFAKKVRNEIQKEQREKLSTKTQGVLEEGARAKKRAFDEAQDEIDQEIAELEAERRTADPTDQEILQQQIDHLKAKKGAGTSTQFAVTEEGETLIPEGDGEIIQDFDAVLDKINKTLKDTDVDQVFKDFDTDKIYALLPDRIKDSSRAFGGLFTAGKPAPEIWESYFDKSDRKGRERVTQLKKAVKENIAELKKGLSTDQDAGTLFDGSMDFLEARKDKSTEKVKMMLPLLSKLKRSFPDSKIIISKARMMEVLIEAGIDPGKAEGIRGLTDGADVYINSEKINAETPIHEFGHIWAQQTRKYRPELYQKGEELIKKSPYWLELLDKRDNRPDSVYYGYDNARLIEEAMATAIGKRGEEIFEAKPDQTQWDKLRGQIWDWIGQKLGYAKVEDLTLHQFVTLAATEVVTGDEFINSFEMAATQADAIKQSGILDYKEVASGSTRNYSRNTPPITEYDTHKEYKKRSVEKQIYDAVNRYHDELNQPGAWFGITTGNYAETQSEIDALGAKYNKALNDKIVGKVKGLKNLLDQEGYVMKRDPINPGFHHVYRKPNLNFSEATPEGKNGNEVIRKIKTRLRTALKRKGDYKKSKVTAKTRKYLESTQKSLELMGDKLTYDQLVDINNKLKERITGDYKAQAETKIETRAKVNDLISKTSKVDATKKVSREDIARANHWTNKVRRIKLSNILAPASNNDFYGLLYNFLPRDLKARKDAEAFINQELIDPLEDANIEYLRMTRDLRDSWAANLKNNKITKSKLVKKSGISIQPGQDVIDLNNDQVVKLYNYIKDPDPKLQQQIRNTGVTPEDAAAIVAYVDADPNLSAFAQGIPKIYEKVFNDINNKVQEHGYEGFDANPNYTPLTVDSDKQSSIDEDLQKAIIGGPGVDLYSVMSGRLKKRRGGGQIDLTSGIEQDFNSYLSGPPRTAAFLDFAQNASNFFGSKQLKAIAAAYGNNTADAFRDSLFRIVSGRNQPNKSPQTLKAMDKYINRTVGGIMFLNVRSGLLQMVSAANYMFDDPVAFFRGGVGKTTNEAAKRIFNSDWYKERGRGKVDVALAELFDQSSGTKFGKFIDKAIQEGYFITKLGDKTATLVGGAPYMAGKYKQYVAQGIDSERAWKMAEKDFIKQSEAAQQSTRAERLGSQQTSSAGKLLLAFANTPMQYSRKAARSLQDLRAHGLFSERGAHEAVKIAYYTTAQNLFFSMAQQGTFAAIGLESGDDERDEKDKHNTWNSVINTLLRGMGAYGALTAAVKDAMKAVLIDERKGLGAVDAAILAASPGASTKVRQLRTAIGDRDPKIESTLELSKGMYQISSALSLANLPSERALKIIEQIADMFADDLDAQERFMRLLGWSRYNVNKDLGKAEGEGIEGLIGENDQYY